MTVTITAVPGAGDAPTPGGMTERTLQDFVTGLQNNPTSGMPHLANPGALASELFGSLRGHFERAQNLQRATRNLQNAGAAGDGATVVLASMSDESRTDLHGGPARESLDPAGADGGMSPAVRVGSAELDRVMALALASLDLSIETTLLTHGTSQVVRSVNNLLRGQ